MSKPRILWATTFSADMWATSASRLIATYQETATPHFMIAFTEGMDLPPTKNAKNYRLENNKYLQDFLALNSAVIPRALGGTLGAPECRCRRPPLDVHSSKHKLPCPGYWFCRNAYRWYRKVISAHMAAEMAADYDILMWVDSDAAFKREVPPSVVASWFGDAGCIYVKNKRTAIETGIVGYHLRQGGRDVIAQMLRRYTSNRFRRDARWDDCVQLMNGIKAAPHVIARDLATDVGPNNTVLQFSPLGEYLEHDKGLHRRTKVLK